MRRHLYSDAHILIGSAISHFSLDFLVFGRLRTVACHSVNNLIEKNCVSAEGLAALADNCNHSRKIKYPNHSFSQSKIPRKLVLYLNNSC